MQHQQGKKHKKRLDKLAKRQEKDKKRQNKDFQHAPKEVIELDPDDAVPVEPAPRATTNAASVSFQVIPSKAKTVPATNALANVAPKPTNSLSYTSKPYSFASSSQNSRANKTHGFILGAGRGNLAELDPVNDSDGNTVALSQLAPPFRPLLSAPAEDFLSLDVDPEKTRKEEKKRKREAEREEAEREEYLRDQRGRLPPWAERRYSYDRLACA